MCKKGGGQFLVEINIVWYNHSYEEQRYNRA